MRVLVTGGLGYIGSHTVVSLLENGHDVTIVDALYNSDKVVKKNIEIITGKKVIFYKIDVASEKLEDIFKSSIFDSIIHFAGFKSVGESVKYPLTYYQNNIMSTINLINLAKKYNVKKIIFSSSATVYGKNISPVDESMKLLPALNPYGETKSICEKIFQDFVKANSNFTVTILRYFNPVGAHKSGLIGEKPNGTPNNLMPYICQVASKIRKELFIFGNDYDTNDGTGIRDYIHVMDLAEAHVVSLENQKSGVNIFNVGTGVGTSVLEMIEMFKIVNKIDINFKFTKRRDGDLAISYADVSKIKRELNWVSKRNLTDMVRDSWNFEKNILIKKNK